MIEPAGADVVGPAVAADDPDAAGRGDRGRCADRRRPAPPARRAAVRARRPVRAAREARTAQLRSREDLVDEVAPTASRSSESGGAPARCGGRRPVATEAELGVVLEQRVRPCRPRLVRPDRPWRGRQVAAVDRRAAGGVGDGQPVAEELREELEVRGSPQPAHAPENSNRGSRNCAAHGAEVDPRAVVGRQLLEERDALALAGQQRLERVEVDRLAPARRPPTPGTPRRRARSPCSPRRTPCWAGVREAGRVERRRPVAGGRAPPARRARSSGADAVRAHEGAVAALDAELGIPDRDQLGDVALLVGRRAAGVGPVDRQRADGEVVPAAGHHRGGDRAHELGRVRGDDRRGLAGGRHPLGPLDLVQAVERPVDRGLVALHHLGAPPSVGLLDRRLDPRDRLVAFHDARDREEAGLQHRVRAPRELGQRAIRPASMT